MTDPRASLASARRLYLHWTQARQPGNPTQLEGDMSHILAGFEAACDRLDVLEAALSSAQADREALMEALKPFAALADHYDRRYGNRPHEPEHTIMHVATHGVGEHEITVGDLRRARDAFPAHLRSEAEGKGTP